MGVVNKGRHVTLNYIVLMIKIKKPDGYFVGDLNKHKFNLYFYLSKVMKDCERLWYLLDAI